MKFHLVDNKYKHHILALERLIRSRYGHKIDIRYTKDAVEFHFPDLVSNLRFNDIKNFIDGYIAGAEGQ